MANDLTRHTGNTRVVLARDLSHEDLTQAIHSPEDPEYVLNRTRVCLKAFYEPEMSMEEKAELIEEYVRALRGRPRWAVAQAWDKWMAQHKRRPSPGEVAILANQAVKYYRDELDYRRKMARPPEPAHVPSPPNPERVQEIMNAAGFTPKRMAALAKHRMASTFDEAENAQEPKMPHWSEVVSPDSPEMRALEAARDANPLIQEARAARRMTPEGF